MRFASLFFLLFGLLPPLTAQVAWPAPLGDSTLHLRPRPVLPGSENLNGIWIGELKQNPGGIAEKFEFSMQLRHHGIFLQGTSFVRFGDIYVEMELSGTRQPNGSWKLTETKILRGEKPGNLEWCMKNFELRVAYTREGIVLTGPWWGNSKLGPCVPGSIHLLRKVKSA